MYRNEHSPNKQLTVAAEEFERSYSRWQRWQLVPALCFFGYAGALLLGQTIYWLRFGDWVELPLLYLFIEAPSAFYYTKSINPFGILPAWFIGTWPWLQDPQSWFGLHKAIHWILSFVHFGVLPLVIGFWVLATKLFEPSKSAKEVK